jgi:hypothetical protein
MYPSIAITGRTLQDPQGTLENEVMAVDGSGSQAANKWCPFSGMRIDPDGCTFWYTTAYYMVTATDDWSTRIVSARFANCH